MEASLFIVPTPIGNLQDITLRALEVLRSVDTILAEDTRTSGKLLSHYGIQTQVRSYHMHNEHRVLKQLVSRLGAGETMALISDAGTPGISDPGFLLVRECIQSGIPVECLPGPTALIPALVNSGFPSDRFVFEGFLPPKKGRQSRLQALGEETRTRRPSLLSSCYHYFLVAVLPFSFAIAFCLIIISYHSPLFLSPSSCSLFITPSSLILLFVTHLFSVLLSPCLSSCSLHLATHFALSNALLLFVIVCV